MDDEKPMCDCCQYEFHSEDAIKTYDLGKPLSNDPYPTNLCYICAASFISNEFQYYKHEGEFKIMQAVAFVGNHVLEQLGKTKLHEKD